MEFPKSFGLVLLVILYLFASVKAVDLDEVKKSAINKLDTQIDNINELVKESSAKIDKEDDKVKAITKHVKEFGEGIFKNCNFEIDRTAVRNNLRANISRSSNEIFKCIQNVEKQSLEDVKKYYNEKFSNILNEAESITTALQKKLVQNWIDDYSKANNQYSSTYKNSVSDIQKATSESAISSVVKSFEKATDQVTEVISDLLPKMAKDPIELLKTLNKVVKDFIVFTTKLTEKTVTAMEKCFPKPFP